jgi:addiction module HigA family antidote
MRTKLKPQHPGTILNRVFLKPLGLSENRLALELRVSVTRISAIVRGTRGITADTALRLARYFGNEPTFWLNLQRDYDVGVAEQQCGLQIARDVRPRGTND